MRQKRNGGEIERHRSVGSRVTDLQVIGGGTSDGFATVCGRNGRRRICRICLVEWLLRRLRLWSFARETARGTAGWWRLAVRGVPGCRAAARAGWDRYSLTGTARSVTEPSWQLFQSGYRFLFLFDLFAKLSGQGEIFMGADFRAGISRGLQYVAQRTFEPPKPLFAVQQGRVQPVQ